MPKFEDALKELGYCLYFIDGGFYSMPLTLERAYELMKEYENAAIIDLRTAEIIA